MPQFERQDSNFQTYSVLKGAYKNYWENQDSDFRCENWKISQSLRFHVRRKRKGKKVGVAMVEGTGTFLERVCSLDTSQI